MQNSIRSVLIIKPSSLGDVVHTLPALRFLKRARPDLSIHWLVNTEWAPLLAGNPDLDGVIEFPRSQFRGVGGLIKLAAWMKKTAWPFFDLALDFQGLARSGLLAKLSGATRIHCLGDAEIVSRLVAHRVVPSKRDIHAVRRYLKLVADLGISIEGPLEFPLPIGEMPQRDRPHWSNHKSYTSDTSYVHKGTDPLCCDSPRQFATTTKGQAPHQRVCPFVLDRPFLLLHPFSRGLNNSLAQEDIEALCLAIQPTPVVIVGRSELKLNLPENCLNLLNQTSIAELIWLIRHAHFTVSVDSGPMHIASAITGRLLGIHTWSDPCIVGPCNPEAWIWKNGALIQVKSLETASGLDGSQNFTSQHLPTVIEFLKEQIKL